MVTFRKYASKDPALHAAQTKLATQVVTVDQDRSLGGKQLARAKIDICMRTSLSRWGNITNGSGGQLACGLLLLQLRFIQPHDYDIRSADGTIGFPAFVTNVHPQNMAGKPQTNKVNRTVDLKPEVGASGIQVGGIGGSLGREFTEELRWTFQAYPDVDENRDYKKLYWGWKDNQKGNQGSFTRPINLVAELRFAEADPDPFQVDVDIHGSLKSKKAAFKRCFYRLAQPSKEGIVHISPNFKTPREALDNLMEQIKKEVEDANLRAAAREYMDVVLLPPQNSPGHP
ncbi:hypothetical protein K461DRAFT_263806 [Myriangium duriaei CBS 260.36]|uniref:Uncharacterized protein n=1 Tax=Myriangium duriaei CBS 260.36 TaxID=1168546 RepID=A0A9P4JDF2_9PEZI|nr:hypothetical protein K461DRAFT_263806 [Myriangium duriaei CBS 260.36]